MTESTLLDILVKISIIQVFVLIILALLKKSESTFRYQIMRLSLILIFSIPVFSVVTMDNSIVLFEFDEKIFTQSIIIENENANNENEILTKSDIANRLEAYNSDRYPLQNNQEKVNQKSNRSIVVAELLKIIYLFVIIIFTLRFIIGSFKLKGLKNRLISNKQLERIRIKLNIKRNVDLYQSDITISPMTWGIRKVIITIPKESDLWNEEMMEMTLLHESIHIKRFDYVLNIISYSMLMILWFNPLSYFFYSLFRIEQEASCDELVMKHNNSSLNYANHLVHIARMLVVKKEFLQAGVNMMNKKQLTKRVKDIFEEKNQMTKKKKASILLPFLIISILTSMSFKTIEVNKKAQSPKRSLSERANFPRAEQRNLSENINLNQKQESEYTPTEHPVARVKQKYTAIFANKINPFGEEIFHKGLDIACAEGTDVIATASGIITFSGEKGKWGLRTEIKHANEQDRFDFQSSYSHMSEILVDKGQRINKGDIIGKVGSTGKSTGPHLHYEVIFKGENVNPKDYMPKLRKKVDVQRVVNKRTAINSTERIKRIQGAEIRIEEATERREAAIERREAKTERREDTLGKKEELNEIREKKSLKNKNKDKQKNKNKE